jgi:staphylococcal nuclease domain-containing protein 1
VHGIHSDLGVSNQNFIGTVLHPAGDIAEALASSGLAKVVDWSITMVTSGPLRLRNAERYKIPILTFNKKKQN